MAQQKPPSARSAETSQGDAWHAFGALVAGVLVYGSIGWVLDRWLETSWLVVAGIMLGVLLGLYMTWARFRPTSEASADEIDKT